MQCPTCGRDVEEFLDGSCALCTSQKAPILEVAEVVDAVQCAHCGRLQRSASWIRVSGDRAAKVEGVVRDAIKVDPRVTGLTLAITNKWQDERNVAITVDLTAKLAGEPLERHADLKVRFKNGACPDCSREVGGYFEGILQVRGGQGTDLDRLLPRIEDSLIRRLETFKDESRPNSFIAKVDRTKHGNDYYFGSKEAARVLSQELADIYGAELDESTKLVGRKDGRDLLRTTHLIRLPPYAKGDFLLVDGVPHKLLHADRKMLQLLDLERHVKVRREVHRLGPYKVIGRGNEQTPAVIVSRSPSHVQIMDPVSFKMVDVPVDLIKQESESVPVFRYEEALYLVVDPSKET